tara:strand:+ start:1245 stop:2075 length:831 start_codon:yes stop_codon:yes gene_type:complete
LKLIIKLFFILIISSCSFKMGKPKKEKVFNTSERASYLVKRSKALRYRGKIVDAIRLMENSALNFLASGNKKEFFLTNIQVLILSLTHDKNREYEKEIKKLENFNIVNDLKMEFPLTIVKSYFFYKKNKKRIAIEILNNYELSNKIEDLSTKIYFLCIRFEISNHDVKKETIMSLDKKTKLYEELYSEDKKGKLNLELLSKASFNLGKAFLKKGDLKKSNYWLLKNYKINKSLQHYVKLVPTLQILKNNYDEMGLGKKSDYYENLNKFYIEFIKSL